MLTIDILKQNKALESLTQEQLNAIVTMSKNDEETVIGSKIGALHGQYDTDIFSVTGIKKNDGEKSYDYAKRVLNEYKTKASSSETLTTEINALKTQKAELEKKISEGNTDTVLKQQLKDATTRITQMTQQLESEKTNYTKTISDLEKNIVDIKVDNVLTNALSGIKFKSNIPESVQTILINSAKAEVLAKGTPDFVDNGKGGKNLVFRNTAGEIIANPKNSLNPYTANELLLETSLKDAIDFGKVQPGTGTIPPKPSQEGSRIIDISTAKNQVEADDMIAKHLLSNGLTRDSKEFSDQSIAIRNENKVSDLPLR